MSTKSRFPRAQAIEVARMLCNALKPATSRLVVAGSLRRGKEEVGDVEILYIPRIETRPVPGDMFANAPTNLADVVIRELLNAGVLELRENTKGNTMFGDKNKLVRHVASSIPVDLFSATEANWWNYLVCRTGPKESNTRISMAAQEKGCQWNPYHAGFTNLTTGNVTRMYSERQVFEFVGLPYLEAFQR